MPVQHNAEMRLSSQVASLIGRISQKLMGCGTMLATAESCTGGLAAAHCTEFTEGWGQLFDYFVFFFFGLIVVLLFDRLTVLHLLYALLSLTVVRMLPVAIALLGTRLSSASVLFMGWFGPRGLASIVLGLVFLEEEARLPGEETVKLAVIATVMLSIFAHGFSALPGISWYGRRVAKLDGQAFEKEQ